MNKQLIRTSLRIVSVAMVLCLPWWTVSARSGATTAKAFTGEVTDTFCAKNGSHLAMMAKMPGMGHDNVSCTKACAQIGGKYVLYDKSNHAVYKLGNQAKVEGFAGRTVRITGTLEGDTINVTNVDAVG